MNTQLKPCGLPAAFLLAGLIVASVDQARGQHVDVQLQEVNGRVMTGFADFDIPAYILGPRTFNAEFGSAPSGFNCDGTNPYCIELPGFNTLSGSNPLLQPPPGETANALPPLTLVEWDFVPVKVDGVVSNLLYWDGSDRPGTSAGITADDVVFGPLPGPDYSLRLKGQLGSVHAAGETEIVTGDVIQISSSSGTLHEHREFELFDGDGNPGTDPADGIYLAGIRFRVGELDRSMAGYIVLGTLLPSIDPLDAGVAWVSQNEELLSPDFGADFDGDLDVDINDLLQLQRGFGAVDADARQAAGDADWNDAIDGDDIAVWGLEAGSTIGTFGGALSSQAVSAVAAVPEPGCCLLLGAAAAVWAARRPSHRAD